MNKKISNLLRISLNFLGAVSLFIGLRAIDEHYANLYVLANTGSSPIGKQIADFPPSITAYWIYVIVALLLWWASDVVKKRSAA